MQAVTHQSIELRAYQLWEAAGRPFGRSDEFWTLASSELAAPVAVVKKAKKAAPKAKAATSGKAKVVAEPAAKPKAKAVAKKAAAKKTAAKKG